MKKALLVFLVHLNDTFNNCGVYVVAAVCILAHLLSVAAKRSIQLVKCYYNRR